MKLPTAGKTGSYYLDDGSFIHRTTRFEPLWKFFAVIQEKKPGDRWGLEILMDGNDIRYFNNPQDALNAICLIKGLKIG